MELSDISVGDIVYTKTDKARYVTAVVPERAEAIQVTEHSWALPHRAHVITAGVKDGKPWGASRNYSPADLRSVR